MTAGLFSLTTTAAMKKTVTIVLPAAALIRQLLLLLLLLIETTIQVRVYEKSPFFSLLQPYLVPLMLAGPYRTETKEVIHQLFSSLSSIVSVRP